VPSSSDHAAAGPLAGYLWQLRRAFLTLLRGDFGDVLQIETIDDIVVVRDGRSVLAAQAKHSFDDTSITLACTEWWRTLRVWLDLSEGELSRDGMRLVLCTTATVSQELSAFARATRNEDIVSQLVDLHDRVATARSNAALAKSYDAWTAAPQARRRAVLTRAQIEPAQPHLTDSRAELDNELRRFGIPAGASLDVIRERLLGWFQTVVETRLAKTGCEVRYDELNDQLTDLRFEMNPSALHCIHSQAPTPSLEDARQDDPRYLRQLDLLNASDDDLELAVAMYHRATAERSYWLDGRITAFGVLKSYEADLSNAWRQKRAPLERLIGKVSEEERGWTLFAACMDYRGNVDGVPAPTHVANGTFHILANQPSDPPEVGWHPRYPELLRRKTP